MASIIDFQNLYTVIKELLPDLGGLVSDFPKIIASAEVNPPIALKYIMETTSKLLQDVSSREGVYIASSKCKDLANALKSKRSVPPVINQHLDMIIEKISLPVVSKNIDEAYNAFESLVSLLQWQHGKYYIVSDDDFDMLLSPEDAGAETGVLNVKDMPKYGIDEDEFKVKFPDKSTKPKDQVFYSADEIKAKNAASANKQKHASSNDNDDIFMDIIPEVVDEEIKKIVTKQHRAKSTGKTDSLKKQISDKTQRQTSSHRKTQINTSKKNVPATKAKTAG
ncbi:MAG: hypothetical protein KAR20_06525, partial [Candidatus Heimdallarchaeota archaeon]|nr:hypothetical protein [Candidatus Heimdallarchaeota archaeon]